MNRCSHTWADTVDAVNRTHAAGLPCGLHLIMGLPGEDEATMLETVDCINELPVDTVKFHQLQLVRGTRMASDVEAGLYDIPRFTAEEYISLCVRILDRLRQGYCGGAFCVAVSVRLAYLSALGIENYQFTNLLHNQLAEARNII